MASGKCSQDEKVCNGSGLMCPSYAQLHKSLISSPFCTFLCPCVKVNLKQEVIFLFLIFTSRSDCPSIVVLLCDITNSYSLTSPMGQWLIVKLIWCANIIHACASVSFLFQAIHKHFRYPHNARCRHDLYLSSNQGFTVCQYSILQPLIIWHHFIRYSETH